MLTAEQKDEFRVGLALLNIAGFDAAKMSRAELVDAGDDLSGEIVTTHEDLESFVSNNGRPDENRTTPAGFTIHEWKDRQLRKGQTRGSLYLMAFDGVSASMWTGG